MFSRHRLFLALGMAATLAACEGGGAGAGDPLAERQTTSPELAVRNFNSQIEATTQLLQIHPANMPARQLLVGLLLARTQYLGTMDDFDSAFAVVDEALAMNLLPAQSAVLHAQVLSAVHRFEEALIELERAEELGATDLAALRQTIALAQGQDPESIVEQRSLVASAAPSFRSQTRLAAALSSAQRYAESDVAYLHALAEYRDVSPFPIAWVAFQRGVMWGESAGDSERAHQLYREAVATLPQYVVANVHLAEIEVEQGDLDAAILRLEAIIDETADPEPASRLAQFWAERDPERSRLYAERADAGYQHYLSKYPLAFADHASEFYLGAGDDAERAFELAMRNLGNRKTRRAYTLAIDAALATDQRSLACDLAREGQISLSEEGC